MSIIANMYPGRAYPGQFAHRKCLTIEELHQLQQLRDNRHKQQDALCDFIFCFFVIFICLCIVVISVIFFGGYYSIFVNGGRSQTT